MLVSLKAALNPSTLTNASSNNNSFIESVQSEPEVRQDNDHDDDDRVPADEEPVLGQVESNESLSGARSLERDIHKKAKRTLDRGGDRRSTEAPPPLMTSEKSSPAAEYGDAPKIKKPKVEPVAGDNSNKHSCSNKKTAKIDKLRRPPAASSSLITGSKSSSNKPIDDIDKIFSKML